MAASGTPISHLLHQIEPTTSLSTMLAHKQVLFGYRILLAEQSTHNSKVVHKLQVTSQG